MAASADNLKVFTDHLKILEPKIHLIRDLYWLKQNADVILDSNL